MIDEKPLYIQRRDISGGVNNRIHGSNIGENQSTTLYNVDIGVPGQTRKIAGLTLVEDVSNNAVTSLYGFEPDGGTNELLMTDGTYLRGCTSTSALQNGGGSGVWTSHKTDFTTSLDTTIIKCRESGSNGDEILVSNGTDNVFRMTQSHTFTDCADINTSPPKTKVYTFFRGRVWGLKNQLLYWSDAYPSDISVAFDRTTNNFKIPVGSEIALLGVRDTGLICVGTDAVYGINPSVTPAATDRAEKILDIGGVARKTFVQVGDDVFGLFRDGVRGIFRTQQDKLQLGASYPLSYPLKDEFDEINWAYISKACAVYFDNKYFISLPTSGATYNNQVWVFYPATQGWMVITGWNVSDFAKLRVNGQELLYAADSTDGKVYRAWYGSSNNGTVINYLEEGRKEDMGQPMIKKVGGEVKVRALATGDADLSVYINFDDSGYNLLGTLDLQGNSLSFPLTFPVNFSNQNVVAKKFHIDNYSPWYTARLKLQNNVSGNTVDVQVLERDIVSFPEEYISEETG